MINDQNRQSTEIEKMYLIPHNPLPSSPSKMHKKKYEWSANVW